MSRVTLYRGFCSYCPYCGRRLQAATSVVLAHVVREHTGKCYEQAKARTERELAAAAQLALPIGGGS